MAISGFGFDADEECQCVFTPVGASGAATANAVVTANVTADVVTADATVLNSTSAVCDAVAWTFATAHATPSVVCGDAVVPPQAPYPGTSNPKCTPSPTLLYYSQA